MFDARVPMAIRCYQLSGAALRLQDGVFLYATFAAWRGEPKFGEGVQRRRRHRALFRCAPPSPVGSRPLTR